MICIIVAVDENNGIGKDGSMPWHFSAELKHFAKTTKATTNPEKRNAVVMGRKTWESLPEKYRPLPGRKNIVLTRNPEFQAEGAHQAETLEKAISQPDCENIFIIGGGSIYEQALELSNLDGIYLTRIKKSYDCDTFFPEMPSKFANKKLLGQATEKDTNFEFQLLTPTL